VIRKLLRRVATLLNLPRIRPGLDFEVQLVRYRAGGFYGLHYDAELHPVSQLPTDTARWATLLVYLNSPDAGGATIFPAITNARLRQAGCMGCEFNQELGSTRNPNSDACRACLRAATTKTATRRLQSQRGNKHPGRLSERKLLATQCDAPNDATLVRPRVGRAVLFQNFLKNGSWCPGSLHGGCPVISGEKWVLNVWLSRQNGRPLLWSMGATDEW
jgi:hypothetical protein